MKNSYKLILVSVLALIITLSGCKSDLKTNTDNPENEIEDKESQYPDGEEDKNSDETKESIIEKYKLEGIVFNDDYTAIIKYPETKEDEEFIVPDFIKEIGSEAFKEHKHIKTVVLPEGLTRIDWSAFQKSSLEKINIPDSVTEIGDFAFFDCANLTDVNASEDMIEKILWGRYCLMFTPFAETTEISTKSQYNWSIFYHRLIEMSRRKFLLHFRIASHNHTIKLHPTHRRSTERGFKQII